MSRTDTQESNKIKSPIKRYITFSGDEGVWEYWDGEKNVQMDSLEFIVMDTRSSIGGWSEAHKARIYSNMVKSTVKTPFTIRAGKATINEGLYADIKNDVIAAGGKFTTNILALAWINGELTPVDIQLSSACLRDWSAFVEASGNIFAVYKGVVSASRGEQQKKGAVKYYTPNFVLGEIAEADSAAADEFCNTTLMPYLNQ
jgi:hypothetical protein